MKKYLLIFIILFSLAFCVCGPAPNAETTVKTLTLASVGRNRELANWVNAFNSSNAGIQIEFIDYSTGDPDPHDALNRLKVEIVSGKGPDLVDLGYYYSPLDASSGILLDLYPFFENDSGFNKEDYFYNIIESFAVGNGLYVLVPVFTVKTFTTVDPLLNGRDGVDVNTLMDIYENRNEGVILYPGETKNDVLSRIVHGSMPNYVDWDSGKCRFDSECFMGLLEFANQFPSTLVLAEDYSIQSIFMDGGAILYPGGITSVFDITSTKLFLGEPLTFIGHPMDAGNGNMAQRGDIAIGISSSSKNQEEAWEFIKSFLSADFQDNIDYGLPVSRTALNDLLTSAMQTEYDGKGEKIAKDYVRFDGDALINIYGITAEDADLLLALIKKVEFNSSTDYFLQQIINEEADYFFNDGRSAEDTATIIQNRASLYLSENK